MRNNPYSKHCQHALPLAGETLETPTEKPVPEGGGGRQLKCRRDAAGSGPSAGPTAGAQRVPPDSP
eukprot:SAG22_NODE_1697_length_3790_cov_1.813601_7_plen_66_part_00